MVSHSLKAMFLASLLGLTAAPVKADTELGIIGAELRLATSDHDLEGGLVSGTVDVAITPYHGAQFDLQYEERSTGGIGRFGTVLYMTPRAGQKYGLSLMLADKNNKSSTYGQLGAVGMFALSPQLDLELQAASGLSADNDLDWIGAGAGLHWQASPATHLYGNYHLAEFDEENFSALAHEVTLGLGTSIESSAAAVYVEASHDWLSGANRADGVTTMRAGVSLALGRSANQQPRFRVSDPMRQILRRGLY